MLLRGEGVTKRGEALLTGEGVTNRQGASQTTHRQNASIPSSSRCN